MKQYEYKREIPVTGNWDIIVAGGGPAGISAAVSAAREGQKVALIERYGILGGNMVIGHVAPILGMVGKGTLRDELLSLIGVAGNDMIGETGLAHDFENAKIAIAGFVGAEKNLDVLLQTPVVDVIMEQNSITALLISTKEGLQIIRGNYFIDASGDGDLAFFAGNPVEMGRESDGLVQPVTLEFTLTDVDEGRALSCIGDVDDVQLNGERFLDFTARCAKEGLLPELMAAVRLHRTTTPGERQVNTTQKNGVNALDNTQLFPAEIDLRRQIRQLVEFLRKYVPGYEKCKIKSSSSTLGVRETRRVIGEYILTAEDMAAGRRFEDVVVHNAEFIVDIHNPAGAGQAEECIQYVKPYDIPWRSLVPVKTDNLILSGRCISGTHRAHASYRITSICIATGQAAGTAAAVCCKEKCLPRQAPVKKIQDALKNQGADLFY
ncbi:FAD-dependent oxidoreductase [Treponema sp. OttesenSCG-928-L16]|nr:FAD-dependent oxidoreductase [Treponema sp. OttesenSCG-928-L16]